MRRLSRLCWFALMAGVLLAACDRAREPDRAQTAATSPAQQTPAEPADLLLTNGYVYTVDPRRSVAEAVAIRDSKIVFVGSAEEAENWVGEDTKVHDLGGRMVMPGLHDMHIHASGVVEQDRCDFKGEAKSLQEMVPFLQGCIEKYQVPDGEWLVVVQWPFSSGNQPSERLPTLRAALDVASQEHPIIMWGNDGHHAAVNSAALATAKDRDGKVVGINKETLGTVFADFKEMIAVDEQGEPTGGINETARLLLRPNMQMDMLGVPADPQDLMPKLADKLASFGITSIQDPYTLPELAELYQWLANSGQMTFRLRTAFFRRSEGSHSPEGLQQIAEHVEHFNAMRDKYDAHEFVQANAVKLFADGVLEGNPWAKPPTQPIAAILGEFQQPIFDVIETTGEIGIEGYVDLDSETCAAVRADPQRYADAEMAAAFADTHGHLPAQCARNSGVLEHSEDYIHEYVRLMTEAGFHVHIHALSDRAVRVATEAFAAVKQQADANGLTQSLTHLQLVHPSDVKRIGELGLYSVFTYVWIFPDPEYELMVVPFVDQVQDVSDLYNPDHYYVQNVYPVKSIVDAGGILTWGSDVPVGSRDPMPFPSMQAAVTRTSNGVVLNPGQRIGIHDALAAYTINGARLMGHDDRLGSIEVGKLADLIVLSQNVVELAESDRAEEIGATEVEVTVFNGRVVYRRE